MSACEVATTLPGSLVFNTAIASLKLGHDTNYLEVTGDGHDYTRSHPTHPRDVAIRNETGSFVGRLDKMSPEWIRDNAKEQTRHEFIVICGGYPIPPSIMRGLSESSEMWLLNIMMVERLRSKPSVARRIGVGQIQAHRWKDCNPRWETVVLC